MLEARCSNRNAYLISFLPRASSYEPRFPVSGFRFLISNLRFVISYIEPRFRPLSSNFEPRASNFEPRIWPLAFDFEPRASCLAQCASRIEPRASRIDYDSGSTSIFKLIPLLDGILYNPLTPKCKKALNISKFLALTATCHRY